MSSPPLFVWPGYALRALEDVAESDFAGAFAEICQRGNPLLQGRPREDLLLLGALIYRRSLCDPVCNVVTASDSQEILGILSCTANVQFAAFAGVKGTHSKELILFSTLFGIIGASHAGYDHRYGHVVNPSMLAWIAETKDREHRSGGEQKFASEDTWELPFESMDIPEELKRELAQTQPGFAHCMLMDLRVFRERPEQVLGALAPALRAAFDSLTAAARARLESCGFPVVKCPWQTESVPASSSRL